MSLASLFLYTLLADIQARLASLGSELRAEILQCAKAYVDNRCEPEMRIPAMERRCAGWEECMGREVVVVGKTRVVAETLAEVVNGFVDVISFKTMVSRTVNFHDANDSPSFVPAFRPSHSGLVHLRFINGACTFAL